MHEMVEHSGLPDLRRAGCFQQTAKDVRTKGPTKDSGKPQKACKNSRQSITHGRFARRSPKIAVPTRTRVAPSSTATR